MFIFKKYKIYLATILLSFVFLGVVVPASVSAADPLPITVIELTNPIGGTDAKKIGTTDIRVILGKIVAKALTVLGSISLIVFVIGGVFFLTSRGNQESIKKGTDTMLWAVIGLLVIFSSYAILNLFLGKLASPDYGAGNLEGVTFYKSTEDVPLKSTASDSAIAKGTVSKGTSCIKSTGNLEAGYIEVADVPVGLEALQTGWVNGDKLEEMDDKSLCTGEGSKTLCEQFYAKTRACLDTSTGYTDAEKTSSCIPKKCSNQILFNTGKTKSLEEGNNFLCCLTDSINTPVVPSSPYAPGGDVVAPVETTKVKKCTDTWAGTGLDTYCKQFDVNTCNEQSMCSFYHSAHPPKCLGKSNKSLQSDLCDSLNEQNCDSGKSLGFCAWE